MRLASVTPPTLNPTCQLHGHDLFVCSAPRQPRRARDSVFGVGLKVWVSCLGLKLNSNTETRASGYSWCQDRISSVRGLDELPIYKVS